MAAVGRYRPLTTCPAPISDGARRADDKEVAARIDGSLRFLRWTDVSRLENVALCRGARTWAGSSEDRVRRFVELGILEPKGDVFRPPDIQRMRVAEALDRAGTPPEYLGEVIAGGGYTFRWVDALFADPSPLSDLTMEQAARELDVPISLIERAYTVWSVATPERGDRLREDDVEMLAIVAEAHHALGGDEERTIAGIRYFGENLRRIAESQIRWFRSTIEEPFLAWGETQPEFARRTTATGGRLLPLARRAVDVGYRRHLDHYLLEDVIENIEVALERVGLAPPSSKTLPAIAFVDLAGYTSFTEREGNDSAARIADRLTEVVRRTTIQAGGRVVKFLGDGAMLHYRDAVGAVRGSLELIALFPTAGLPPGHAGVNAGPVVFRDGDYYGRAVNVAARVADRASPGEVLVTEDAIPDRVPDDLRFEFVERATLKGVTAPVALYRAHRGSG